MVSVGHSCASMANLRLKKRVQCTSPTRQRGTTSARRPRATCPREREGVREFGSRFAVGAGLCPGPRRRVIAGRHRGRPLQVMNSWISSRKRKFATQLIPLVSIRPSIDPSPVHTIRSKCRPKFLDVEKQSWSDEHQGVAPRQLTAAPLAGVHLSVLRANRR